MESQHNTIVVALCQALAAGDAAALSSCLDGAPAMGAGACMATCSRGMLHIPSPVPMVQSKIRPLWQAAWLA